MALTLAMAAFLTGPLGRKAAHHHHVARGEVHDRGDGAKLDGRSLGCACRQAIGAAESEGLPRSFLSHWKGTAEQAAS
jgi:hypothetical protein